MRHCSVKQALSDTQIVKVLRYVLSWMGGLWGHACARFDIGCVESITGLYKDFQVVHFHKSYGDMHYFHY